MVNSGTEGEMGDFPMVNGHINICNNRAFILTIPISQILETVDAQKYSQRSQSRWISTYHFVSVSCSADLRPEASNFKKPDRSHIPAFVNPFKKEREHNDLDIFIASMIDASVL